MHNLDILGVAMNSIQYLVLSHGHSGHVGGAMQVGAALTESCVILHPGIFRQKLKRKGKEIKPTGSQSALRKLESTLAVKTTTSQMWLSDSVVVSGEIPFDKKTSSSSEARYFVEGHRGIEPDSFEDELALGIKIRDGVLVVTSCTHRGVVNTVRYVLSLFPGSHLFGIIGGFHLFDNQNSTTEMIERLRPLGPRLLAPCHCTGTISSTMFYFAFPKEFRRFATGDVITIE